MRASLFHLIIAGSVVWECSYLLEFMCYIMLFLFFHHLFSATDSEEQTQAPANDKSMRFYSGT